MLTALQARRHFGTAGVAGTPPLSRLRPRLLSQLFLWPSVKVCDSAWKTGGVRFLDDFRRGDLITPGAGPLSSPAPWRWNSWRFEILMQGGFSRGKTRLLTLGTKSGLG